MRPGLTAKNSNPGERLGAQRAQRDSTMRIGKIGKSFQAGIEQGPRPAMVTARVMMERRSDLDDALQEGLFRFRRTQPDFFPAFVRLEKTAAIELLDSLLEGIGVNGPGHGSPVVR